MVADYLTQQDVDNFGPEILDVVRRGAREAVAPAVNRLERANEELRDRVARETKRNLGQALERVVAKWQGINRDPRWLQWLADHDVYSGQKRQELLNDAVASGDAQRVINFFRGFLREAGAPQQAQAWTGQPRQAPGGTGRIYTRHQITEMARRRQK